MTDSASTVDPASNGSDPESPGLDDDGLDPGDLRNRTLPSLQEPPSKTTPTSWRELVKDRLGTILGSVLIAAGIAVYAGWELQIPRFWYVYGLSFVFLLPAGWFVASYANSWFPKPEPDWLVDLDARTLDGALIRFPAGTLADLDTPEGEQIEQWAPHLYAARGVDLEELEAGGTWRGSMTDRELLVALEAVYECRGRLEEQARRGFAIEKRFFSILRSTTRDEVLNVVRTFEEGSLPDDANSLHGHIEDALEEHGIDDQIKTGADDFDLADSLTRVDGSSETMVASDRRTNGAGADD